MSALSLPQRIHKALLPTPGISRLRWHAYQVLGVAVLLVLLLVIPLHSNDKNDLINHSWHQILGVDHTTFCMSILPWVIAAGTFSVLLILLAGVLEEFTLAWRQEKQQFFETNGETPLTRAAYKLKNGFSNDPRWGVVVLVAMMCFAIGFLMLHSLIGATPQEIEHMLSKSTALAESLLMVGVVVIGAAGLFWAYYSVLEPRLIKLKNSSVSRRLIAKWNNFTKTDTLNEEYENLPATEKAALLAQAKLLGVSPDDPAIRRVAIADYQARVAAASKQAQELDQNTPSTHAVAPPKRF